MRNNQKKKEMLKKSWCRKQESKNSTFEVRFSFPPLDFLYLGLLCVGGAVLFMDRFGTSCIFCFFFVPVFPTSLQQFLLFLVLDSTCFEVRKMGKLVPCLGSCPWEAKRAMGKSAVGARKKK
jgi:hypothetical protein